MRLVIHAADRNAEIVIDGRGISIPPNEPFEVLPITSTDHMTSDYEYQTNEKVIAEEMVRLLWHCGLVEIPIETVKTRTGIKYAYDVDKALDAARQRLTVAENKMLQEYVDQSMNFIHDNKAARPPAPPVEAIIKKYGIDLKAKYGFVPPGYDVAAAGAAKNAEMDGLKKRLDEQSALIDKLLALQTKQSEGKKS